VQRLGQSVDVNPLFTQRARDIRRLAPLEDEREHRDPVVGAARADEWKSWNGCQSFEAVLDQHPVGSGHSTVAGYRLPDARLINVCGHSTLAWDMRRITSGLLTFAFAAVFLQSPWAHVHDPAADPDHYREQHAGLGVIHGHDDHDVAAAAEWTADSSDRAHFLGPIKGLHVIHAANDFIVRASRAMERPSVDSIVSHVEFEPRANGPPGSPALPSRAPPA
jgi:hypothetical protein